MTERARPRWLIVASGTLICCLLAACSSKGSTNQDAAKVVLDGPPVVVVGDSLMEGADDFGGLKAAVEAQGTPYSADTRVGRKTSESVEPVTKAIAGKTPGILVIGLGTNDPVNLEQFRTDLDRVMVAAAGWKVLWLKPTVKEVQPLNEVLDDAARRFKNLTLLDYAPVLAEHPEYIGGDGVHDSTPGYKARATFIADAIKQA